MTGVGTVTYLVIPVVAVIPAVVRVIRSAILAAAATAAMTCLFDSTGLSARPG
jgi:hypothetical protein